MNEEKFKWLQRCEMVMDGDLPKFLWFEGCGLKEEIYGTIKCNKCHNIEIVKVDSPYVSLKEKWVCSVCKGDAWLFKPSGAKLWVGMNFPILGKPIPASSAEIYDELYEFLKDTIEFTVKDHYELIALWIMMTWRIRELQQVPYLLFVGPIASGKTYALEVLNEVCYHPIFVSSVSPAALVLDIADWIPTLLVDQAEQAMNRKWEGGDIMYRIVTSGYRQGAMYRRRLEGRMRNVSFPTFCPKAFSSTQVWDSALNTRCYVIEMREAERNYEIDKERAFELRRKLLYWSFGGSDHYPLPMVDTDLVGRKKDLALSLLRVASDCGLEEVVSRIESYTEKQWARTISHATEEELSGLIISAIFDILTEECENYKEGTTVHDLLKESLDVRIYVDEIWKRLGGELGPKKTRISRELSAMGLERKKTGARRYVSVSTHREVLLHLLQKFGFI